MTRFKVRLCVLVPIDYQGIIEAESEEEAIAILADDLRNSREIGEFDVANADFDNIDEEFLEDDRTGIFVSKQERIDDLLLTK